ncbi:MAG: ATP-binding cassette domain-containing protein [Bacteroidetes bacterium]|nr:MAG: ATP-binding cassette domain-containing protein [Bacteroidota bacterium]
MSVVVKHLTKYYGDFKAVENLSFEVRPGEIVGLLGPNGAGKTTSVRIITGFLMPTSGTVEVGGKDIRKHPYETRRMIGYLPEENPLYPDMDVIDYLEFIAELQDVPRSDLRRRVRFVLDTFQLHDVKEKKIGQLSKGYRQRVGLAQSLIQDPKIIIFDEPTNGLDPNQVMEFRKFLTNLGKDKTVILSSHALAEVQAVCNRVIIIGKGKVLADAPISELQRKFVGKDVIVVEVARPDGYSADAVMGEFERLQYVVSVTHAPAHGDGEKGYKFFLDAQKNMDVRKHVTQLCTDKNWTLLSLQQQTVRIEDIFHQLTVGKEKQ